MKVLWSADGGSEGEFELVGVEYIQPHEKLLSMGVGVAKEIAEYENSRDGEAFRNGGALTILEPKALAGVYSISVDYTPHFSASRTEPR